MTDWKQILDLHRDPVPARRKPDPDPSACVICGVAPRTIHSDGSEDETCGSIPCRDEWYGQLWGRS